MHSLDMAEISLHERPSWFFLERTDLSIYLIKIKDIQTEPHLFSKRHLSDWWDFIIIIILFCVGKQEGILIHHSGSFWIVKYLFPISLATQYNNPKPNAVTWHQFSCFSSNAPLGHFFKFPNRKLRNYDSCCKSILPSTSLFSDWAVLSGNFLPQIMSVT